MNDLAAAIDIVRWPATKLTTIPIAMEFEKMKKFILAKLRKELPGNLTYHNTRHIKDVYASARRLARMEKVKGEDLTLLLTAVLFHDTGFLWQPYEHEKVSCEIAMEYLPAYGYAPDQVKRICGMIMATRIPQSPTNLLEQLMCDADLDYLGRDDFFLVGNGLYYELAMYGMITSVDEWNNMQLRFLEKHTYFTASAKLLRAAKKEEYIAILKSRINTGS